jgi:hypothetical protein
MKFIIVTQNMLLFEHLSAYTVRSGILKSVRIRDENVRDAQQHCMPADVDFDWDAFA